MTASAYSVSLEFTARKAAEEAAFARASIAQRQQKIAENKARALRAHSESKVRGASPVDRRFWRGIRVVCTRRAVMTLAEIAPILKRYGRPEDHAAEDAAVLESIVAETRQQLSEVHQYQRRVEMKEELELELWGAQRCLDACRALVAQQVAA